MKYKLIIFPFILFLFQLSELFPFEGKIISTNPKFFIHAPFNGTVREINVRDGSLVEEGGILLKFDVSPEINQQNQLKSAYLKILAIQARLNAHTREKSAVLYPKELTDEIKNHPELKSILDAQKKEFYSLQNEQQVLQTSVEERNRQLQTIMFSINDRLRKAEADLDKVNQAEQIAIKRIEIPYGKYKLDYVQRIKREVQEKVDSIRAELHSVQAQIHENNIYYNETISAFKTTARQGMDQSHDKMSQIKEQLIQLQYKIDSGTIRSPIAGTVEYSEQINLNQQLATDQVIMVITPSNDYTLIEGYLLDKPSSSLKKLNVNFLQPDIPPMDGEVTYITPGPVDIDGKNFYIVYIKVPNKALENYPALQPGSLVDLK